VTEARLKAGIIVQAAIRQAGMRGIPATVVRHGDDDAGQVFAVINRGRDIGFVLLAPSRDYETGKTVWRRPLGEDPVPEREVDAYLERERSVDPDLWVLEIEDRNGWHPFDDMF
jgi:GMP synthase (glutamine-hydrolysing)